ncbi:hypothetical protein EV383_4341 [Pseudonocardia sediminis]|uniref:Uncharacterized protein n=1 Tax=Pseudonocardia sediminis TaxID=1397368 RepID=A0A4Q7V1V1_PSEST|nr:hypothetical protein EV383_4341 [Pseudonocardia sediminis]
MTCRKQRFDSERAALGRAYKVGRTVRSSARPPVAYRCQDGCKKDNGQRAWHWANFRPRVRRAS